MMAKPLDGYSLVEKFKVLPLKALESYILDSTHHLEKNWCDVKYLLFKMPWMGYKDEPDFDEEGKPILRRTTPLHLLARGALPLAKFRDISVRELFDIYRFDLNYIDEFGLTHFHVACRYGYEEVARRFLDLGVDPNLPAGEIDDTPLLLALDWRHKKVAELLLRRGAHWNLPNKNGLTPLHVTCQTNDGGNFMEFFFNINDHLHHQVQVNSSDKFGDTPLHFAMFYGNKKKVELLLRRGADSNLRNAEGSTPLHIVCYRRYNHDSAKSFFKINKELNRPVLINAADNHGRTPLQLAVANIAPVTVHVLLNNGADVSSFVFPDDSYFGKEVKQPENGCEADFQLKLVEGTLFIIERLKTSGYELSRSDASKIMKLFDKPGLNDPSL
ncbi:serine/threonine-protein phosphatase 6 regulatory ankyrin repeat subunit A-like [Trichogramma pretiosum]|uniref:serine/threonine-protein phosphatase 6 regulatory ankyrin repeat subunit A-like n=1 Tax=Trichogramma pretiosum TaxID=7493 RepID=UPI000C71C736|nr:serine/threonine-protein phosphatase 6 regulatory ankyrin repeat subunit A-like [Trichogramma pretiosum]